MDLSIYFNPVAIEGYQDQQTDQEARLGHIIKCHDSASNFPSLSKVHIALIGVEDDRAAVNNEGCANAPNAVRQKLYALFSGDYKARIIDLGNIKAGHEINDTYYALTEVVTELIERKILPVIIGGGQDLTFANYKAYEKLQQIANIVSIDSQFDLGQDNDRLHSQSYLSKIILNQPNFLFNYTNIGYQTYFVSQDAIRLIDKLFFDSYRLGQVRKDVQEVEPMVRNADMLSFDIGAVRQSDAPGNKNAGPHGFYGDEACQICWYAGMSDKLTSLGFYEYNPMYDPQGHTAHLIAQMIWYVFEGFYNRKGDFPIKTISRYMKYMVQVEGHSQDLVFYKSKESERWWMEVINADNIKAEFKRHYIIPCSPKDYDMALQNEIPDRWWQAYQKLM
ncbi:MAG: formimidoylglutamase [Bacteroidales bacterium]|nr:formimidoylglutamase [Bacteroidales bacterium]